MRPILLAPLILLAAPLGAQQPPKMPTTPPGAPILSRVTAGLYKADPAHTQILFRVNHLGFSEFDGAFADATGTLTIDPKNPTAAHVDIDIPMERIVTTNAALDEHLKKPDFFDAAKYPTAHFTSTSVKAIGATAKISGNLTIKGVTKPVVLDARFVGAGAGMMGNHAVNVGFRATTALKRSDFGLGYGVPMVSDDVDLTINAAFEKQP